MDEQIITEQNRSGALMRSIIEEDGGETESLT